MDNNHTKLSKHFIEQLHRSVIHKNIYTALSNGADPLQLLESTADTLVEAQRIYVEEMQQKPQQITLSIPEYKDLLKNCPNLNGDRLKYLMSLCKCSLSIEINPHKDYYQSFKEWFDEIHESEILAKDIGVNVLDEIVRRDCCIEIIAFPDTPNGSYMYLHYDLDEAVEHIIVAIELERKTRQ